MTTGYTSQDAVAVRTVRRTCNLCEAGCGLEIDVKGDRVTAVRPDDDDPISRGYVCPKGLAIGEIQNDPDRLRRPLRRGEDGRFHEISWNDAFDLVGERLRTIRARDGADAIAVYFGNPLVHNLGGVLTIGALVAAIGTKNRMSASSQDTAPRFAASYYLYGNTWAIPVPDVDRTDYFLCIGANPAVSQGSFMAGPDVRSRIRRIRERGGKVVTVDPRRTETSKLSDEHVFIRPGTDAALLLAMAQVLVSERRVDVEALQRLGAGWAETEKRLDAFTPEAVAASTGIEPSVIRRLAVEFATAPTSVCYTRIGTCNSLYGTLGTYAGDLLNFVAGRLGAVGGAVFPEPALDIGSVATRLGINGHGRWRTRVRGLPETGCDLPAAALAEEIETPGRGRVRALVTVAGNPVLSTPNGRRLDRALESLDFYVAVDMYVNETTRHADVILPPCWALAESHMEPATPNTALYNAVRVSPPVVEKRSDERADWEILLVLAERMGGGPTGKRVLDRLLSFASRFGWKWDPLATADLMIRSGPRGDKFLPGWLRRALRKPEGLRMTRVLASEYGVDLGPLRPGVERRLAHSDRRVHLAERPVIEEIDRLAGSLASRPQEAGLLLVGRRDLRSNNSWMHNAPSLVSGRDRCVLFVHPDDARRAGLRDSEPAWLESRVGARAVPVRVTDEMMPGVVSLPHGWGHEGVSEWQKTASAHAGVSANDWTDDQLLERIVGQSVLNGVPVRLRPVSRADAAA
jgi:anaerobic selenocysteine-containing dehydrogenase